MDDRLAEMAKLINQPRDPMAERVAALEEALEAQVVPNGFVQVTPFPWPR